MVEIICDGEPVYLAKENGKRFLLSRDWEAEVDGLILVVPKGYHCDLASVPLPFFWWQFGKWNIAAIAHDYLYDFGYILVRTRPCGEFGTGLNRSIREAGEIYQQPYTKHQADVLFWQLCRSLGVTPITARLMFWAVHFFGSWRFD
jgi:Protein of unknown function (DUF1353)